MRSNLVVLFDKIISRKFVSFCYESFNLNAIFCAFCSSKKAANLLVLILFPEQIYIIILMASLSLALQISLNFFYRSANSIMLFKKALTNFVEEIWKNVFSKIFPWGSLQIRFKQSKRLKIVHRQCIRCRGSIWESYFRFVRVYSHYQRCFWWR